MIEAENKPSGKLGSICIVHAADLDIVKGFQSNLHDFVKATKRPVILTSETPPSSWPNANNVLKNAYVLHCERPAIGVCEKQVALLGHKFGEVAARLYNCDLRRLRLQSMLRSHADPKANHAVLGFESRALEEGHESVNDLQNFLLAVHSCSNTSPGEIVFRELLLAWDDHRAVYPRTSSIVLKHTLEKDLPTPALAKSVEQAAAETAAQSSAAPKKPAKKRGRPASGSAPAAKCPRVAAKAKAKARQVQQIKFNVKELFKNV